MSKSSESWAFRPWAPALPRAYPTDSVHDAALREVNSRTKLSTYSLYLVIIKNTLTDLCGNWLLPNDVVNTFCEIRTPASRPCRSLGFRVQGLGCTIIRVPIFVSASNGFPVLDRPQWTTLNSGRLHENTITFPWYRRGHLLSSQFQSKRAPAFPSRPGFYLTQCINWIVFKKSAPPQNRQSMVLISNSKQKKYDVVWGLAL